jgi:glycosyltransferase involved in cell wall biosynthesis
MKKIALIVKNTTFNKSFGGLEVHTKGLIDLLSTDYKIDIFAPKRELKNSEVSENNKTFYFINANYKTGFFSDFFNGNWNRELLTFFKSKYIEEKYDLIISISSAAYPLLNKKKDFDCKFLTVSHGTALSEFISLYNESGVNLSLIKNLPYFLYNFLWKQKNFIRDSDFVVCVSDFVKNSLIRETNSLDNSKFKTIFNGVSVDKVFNKDFENEGKLKILFSGRVEKSKGIFILLDAIKNLNIELFIAGDGNSLDEAKKYALENKLNEKVTFLGRLSFDKLKKYYEESDILVVPSLRIEGFPMSILEGMSYFLPVIASKVGGNVDAVLDNKTGFLIEAGDSSELRERIDFFNTHPNKIKEFGINANNLVLQRFSNTGMIKEYQEVIRKLIK